MQWQRGLLHLPEHDGDLTALVKTVMELSKIEWFKKSVRDRRGFKVVAVVTQPDKPVGRHQDTLQPSLVKQYAVEHGLPVLQPKKKVG